ncbi:response regulator transcription factor [Vulcanococcus sp. DEBay_Sum29NL08_54]|uniref:response regulator transcription factor n=1 Tax=Vulcanococcus sp. DEBay_Sum29NL08_54 TaxID=2806303 RepID=UPI0025F741CE|nr:response regulator transcription factor [Vulcanococcus sp. DEBay_Sum29NL08_54]
MEDQLMFLQLLRSLLEAMAGIEVIGSATSCQEALELCEQDPPDLLVLDLALPDGEGLDVARTLHRRSPESKVVVLSGQASSFVCPPELLSQICGVVDKTAAFQQLHQVLEQLVPQPITTLTPRQQEIYALIGRGLSNKEISKETALSIATVETHRKAIAQKLGLSGAELVHQASRLAPLTIAQDT